MSLNTFFLSEVRVKHFTLLLEFSVRRELIGNLIMKLITSFLLPKLKLFKDQFKFLFNPRKEEMSYNAILEYLNTLSKIYFSASKKEKSKLLDHAIQVTKLQSYIENLLSGHLKMEV